MSEKNETETFDEAPSLEIDDVIIDEVRQESAVQASSRNQRSGMAGFLSFLALLLAAGGIAAGYYLYDKEIRPLGKLSGKLTELRQFTASKQALGDVQQQLQEIRESNQSLQSELSNAGGDYQSLEATLNQLRQQAGFGRREWSLAEVEYLINIARDRLQYMHDSKTAVAALQGALNRIDAMADPGLSQLRKQIVDDLQGVETYQAIDAEQLLQKLTVIASDLQPLPESPQISQPAQQTSKSVKEKGLQEHWTSFKQALTSRVRIVEHEQPLNALKQRGVPSYKIDILNLRIEILRLTLLRNDMAAFKRELKSLASWADASLPSEQAASIVAETQMLEQFQQAPLPQIQANISGLASQESEPMESGPIELPGKSEEIEKAQEEKVIEADPVETDPVDSPAIESSNDSTAETPMVSETMKQEAAPAELIRLQEMLEQIEATEKQGDN